MQQGPGAQERLTIPLPTCHRDGLETPDQPTEQPGFEEIGAREEMQIARESGVSHQNRVEMARVIGHDQQSPAAWNEAPSTNADAKIEPEKGGHQDPGQSIGESHDAGELRLESRPSAMR